MSDDSNLAALAYIEARKFLRDVEYCNICLNSTGVARPSTGFGRWKAVDPYDICGARLCDECKVEKSTQPEFNWKERHDIKAIRRLQRLVADYECGRVDACGFIR